MLYKQTYCIMELYTTVIRMSKRRDDPKAVNVTAFISAQIRGIFLRRRK